MITYVLTFAIVLDAILADLKIVEDEKFESDMAVKELDCAKRECFYLPKEYKYIAN